MSAPIIHASLPTTGWRDVTSLVTPELALGGKIRVLRTWDRVTWKLIGPFGAGVLLDVPGWLQPDHQPWDRPTVNIARHGSIRTTIMLNLGGVLAWADTLNLQGGDTDSACSAELSYACLRPIPPTSDWIGIPA